MVSAIRRILQSPVTLLVWLARGIARSGLLPAGLEWKLKCVFFAVLRPLLENTREYREFLDVKSWKDQPPPVVEETSDEPATFEVAPASPDREDIVVFGIIDWNFRFQRPQHLAQGLAVRGHRVFYLAPGFVPDTEPGFRVAPLHTDLKLYEVRLHAPSGWQIYAGEPTGAVLEQLIGGLRQFLGSVGIQPNWSMVCHPGWRPLATMMPRSRMAYDCMDNHHGFATAEDGLVRDEFRLVRESDLLIVTSQWLVDEFKGKHPALRLIRNGCDPNHFAPPMKPRPQSVRPVIGYFGAMAEWFDKSLLRATAEEFDWCDFLLVGDDTGGIAGAMRGLRNVEMTGEVPYDELPGYVNRMDVCLIPFLIDDLTRATNPVKAYEALAAGKPVVATPMPELETDEFQDLVRTAEAGPEFLDAVGSALEEIRMYDLARRRREFASHQSWAARGDALVTGMREVSNPSVTVVVITWNNEKLTRRCLASVLNDPSPIELEVIVVDNASKDGTVTYLTRLAGEDARVTPVFNDDNLGFSRAVNIGLARARGDYLVVLNNDVVVTPGWLRTFVNHLRRDDSIGIVGPITNNIGNEAKVSTSYRTMGEMLRESTELIGSRAGSTFDIGVLAFLCVMFSRSTYETIGPLDEGFGLGFFEDDDYCMRIREIGKRVVCVEDVFVHHELSASFKKVDRKKRDELFERNKKYYESKWGTWQPHVYRAEERSGKSRSTA